MLVDQPQRGAAIGAQVVGPRAQVEHVFLHVLSGEKTRAQHQCAAGHIQGMHEDALHARMLHMQRLAGKQLAAPPGILPCKRAVRKKAGHVAHKQGGYGVAQQPAGHPVGIELEDGLDEPLPRSAAKGILLPGIPHLFGGPVNARIRAEDGQRDAGLPHFTQQRGQGAQLHFKPAFMQRMCGRDDDGAHAPVVHHPAQRFGAAAGGDAYRPCPQFAQDGVHPWRQGVLPAHDQHAPCPPCTQEFVKHCGPSLFWLCVHVYGVPGVNSLS